MESEKEVVVSAPETIKEEENKKEEVLISIDDFFKSKIVIAKVLKCEIVEGADRLLKSTLDVGGEERIVVSGIRQFYTPEEMVGKTVVLLENLQPRKIRGIESKGMLLCAEDENGVCVLTTDKPKESGAGVR